MATVKILNIQADGHSGLGFPAKRAELAASDNTDRAGLTAGAGLGVGADRKQHPAFEQTNQYQGADDRKPQHPNQMTSEQIAEGAVEAQQIDPKLTPSPEFSHTHTPSPTATPKSSPAPRPTGG